MELDIDLRLFEEFQCAAWDEREDAMCVLEELLEAYVRMQCYATENGNLRRIGVAHCAAATVLRRDTVQAVRLALETGVRR